MVLAVRTVFLWVLSLGLSIGSFGLPTAWAAAPKPITCVGIFNTYATTRDGQELSYDSYKNATVGDSISSIKGEDRDYVCYVLWGHSGHSPFKGLCEGNQRCRVVGTCRKRVGNTYFVDYTEAHSIEERALEGDRAGTSVTVLMQKVGGTFVVPVEINGAITLDFTIDSGAADVSVPLDVFSTLWRKGTIQDGDIIGEQTYKAWDGSTQKTFAFTIKSLKVGNVVVEDVRGGVAPLQRSLLLGQSFLERFKSWSINNTKHVLFLEPQ
jgi:clan AA aspartic protease (TIGR02281 family)